MTQNNNPEATEQTTEIPTVTDESSYGAIRINHSVVASIVRLAALEVEGTHSVGGMGGISEGISDFFKGSKETDKGVKVAEDEANNYIIEIRVILRFGVELAKVALAIQQNVKEQVARMTMNGVAKVDVIIEGVKMESDVETAEEFDPHTD